jgi:hypothetical protein
MRVWLYDTLVADTALRTLLGVEVADDATMGLRIKPRQSETRIPPDEEIPFIIYGLGNETNEGLAEANDHVAERQFFSIWIHDRGGDYTLIDSIVARVKVIFKEVSAPSYQVTMINYLETSQEFENQTYNTLFRYVRFQAIISKGAAA